MSRTVKIECGISFRLRETGATKPTPITCFVEYNGKPVVKIPTGTKVHPAKWNPEKERPIGGLKGLESAEANAIVEKLATVKATVESEYRTFVNKFQSYPDKTLFKEQVLQSLSGAITVKASDPSQSLISFFDRQVKLSREGKRTVLKGKRAGMRYKENTIRSYEGSRTLLQEYVEHRKLKRLNFDNVTMDFYYDLRDYMFEDRSFSLNYFGKVIKHIKLFMGEAKELGWHANEIYRSKAFIKVEEETDAVYNDIEQLGAIHSVDLTGHPGLKNARDLYLLGAWSGLRFQDYSVLADKARVHGDFIHIETEKTGVFVAIPILPVTREILESYRLADGTYLYPKPISNQKLNDYIKIIGKMAGLTQPVSITVPQGGTRVHVTIPFYEAMGTHTARRSFATNMYKHYRLPTFTIMKITGHTTETNFFKYIKMTREENAQLILDTVTAKIELDKAG
ncbi:phage integrase SAM-like domain-containing protein [Sphingobacterium thalpophilum]|uniref:phage integrase SAM-like domain-containing protein n=1 Tax=Sphingobacterium TaxID=28453 RepID=UPI002FDC93E9